MYEPFGGTAFSMNITIGKILALWVAVGYAAALIVQAHGATADVAGACVFLLFPLALIWFPDQLGSMTGYIGRGGNIDTETPPILVSILGWFFLVGLPVLLYLLK